MAIYRFSFDDKYAGHTVVITNASGNEVNGPPVTLDLSGDAVLDLPTGIYKAQVDNAQGAFGDGYSVVDGVIDIPASIDAAGGAILSGQSYDTYSNSGFTPDGEIFTVPWDTIDPGLEYDTASRSIILPANGIYAVAFELDFDTPAESWRCFAQIGSAAEQAVPAVVGDLLPGAGGGWQRSAVFGSGVVRVSGERKVAIPINLVPDPAVGSPTLPPCSFAQLTVTRIA